MTCQSLQTIIFIDYQINTGRDLSFLYLLTGIVLRPFLRLFARLQPIGLENIPKDRGFVLVANHVGWIDPLWIGLALWPRPVCPMAKKELFYKWPLRSILNQLGAFPVTRGAASLSEIRRPIEILQAGGIVVIFPGGTRESQMSGVKRGAATIALAAGAPIVPVYFDGPGNLRFADLFRRATAVVRVGLPIELTSAGGTGRDARKEAVLEAVRLIEERLGQLGVDQCASAGYQSA